MALWAPVTRSLFLPLTFRRRQSMRCVKSSERAFSSLLTRLLWSLCLAATGRQLTCSLTASMAYTDRFLRSCLAFFLHPPGLASGNFDPSPKTHSVSSIALCLLVRKHNFQGGVWGEVRRGCPTANVLGGGSSNTETKRSLSQKWLGTKTLSNSFARYLGKVFLLGHSIWVP